MAVSGFASSVGFGLALGRLGAEAAYLVMGLGLTGAIAVAAIVLRRDLAVCGACHDLFPSRALIAFAVVVVVAVG